MLVNFDDTPRNSIIYTASIILEYLKQESSGRNFDKLYEHCMKINMEYSLFFLSLDWLFLIGIIKEIDERNEVILWD